MTGSRWIPVPRRLRFQMTLLSEAVMSFHNVTHFEVITDPVSQNLKNQCLGGRQSGADGGA